MFSCEYCETFKNTYFEDYLRTAASFPAGLCFSVLIINHTGFYIKCYIRFRLFALMINHSNFCIKYYLRFRQLMHSYYWNTFLCMEAFFHIPCPFADQAY